MNLGTHGVDVRGESLAAPGEEMTVPATPRRTKVRDDTENGRGHTMK